jgi:3-oxoacyl-[acyl-carrier-protein] synthase III
MAEAAVKSLGFTMKDLKAGNEELRALLDRAKIIPHQANGRIIDGLRDKLGVRDDQVYKTIYRYGNISAASNLVTLDYAVREGNMRRVEQDGLTVEIQDDEAARLQPGDLVLTPTVGAGYRIGCFTFVHD